MGGGKWMVNGWMDGLVVDGQVDEEIDGRVECRWMSGGACSRCLGEWMMDGRKDGRTYRQAEYRRFTES